MNIGLPPRWHRVRYPLAVALCVITTLAAAMLREWMDLANIVMLYLLAVFVAAVWFGRGPALVAAFLSVAFFDFFLIPPHLSFAVADAQYLVTFAVMLAVGLITSHLVALLAERTEQAQTQERDTRALYELSRDLGAALSIEEVTSIAAAFLHTLELDATLLIADNDAPEVAFEEFGSHHLGKLELGFARSAFERRATIEADTLAGTGVAVVFLPLGTSNWVRGVLAITPRTDDVIGLRSRRSLLEAVASLAATIVERLHYAEAARRSDLDAAAERLRTSILSSLSHDLRTPLTSLVGLADTLAQSEPPLPEAAIETVVGIRDQAHAMHHLLSNLLEMARLKAGNITLNKEWQPFEEIVGSSTRLLAELLAGHHIDIDLPRDLPLVNFDAVLLERVICNLLENAAKYSPAGSRIQLSALAREGNLEVCVSNEGSGFPPDRIDQVFELFVRGEREAAIAGTGMGLAICKAIVEAHGGTIAAENKTGGACVRFTLPLGSPPPAIIEEGAP